MNVFGFGNDFFRKINYKNEKKLFLLGKFFFFYDFFWDYCIGEVFEFDFWEFVIYKELFWVLKECRDEGDIVSFFKSLAMSKGWDLGIIR